MGGYFERMIGTVKLILKKLIMNEKLLYDELITVLLEIEVIVNNRPLTFVSTDVMEPALTPNHMLFGRKLNVELNSTRANVENEIEPEERAKVVKEIIDTFWKRWSNEYLIITIRTHKNQSGDTITSGEIVYMKDERMKRL